jgi:hypothetical protein
MRLLSFYLRKLLNQLPYKYNLVVNIIFFSRLKIGDMGSKQAEPRLELKKHRRQSRKKTNQAILDDIDDDDNLLDEDNDPFLNAMRNGNP